MEKKKRIYSFPSTDVLVVRCEGSILVLSDPNAVAPNSSSSGYDSDNDLGEFGN